MPQTRALRCVAIMTGRVLSSRHFILDLLQHSHLLSSVCIDYGLQWINHLSDYASIKSTNLRCCIENYRLFSIEFVVFFWWKWHVTRLSAFEEHFISHYKMLDFSGPTTSRPRLYPRLQSGGYYRLAFWFEVGGWPLGLHAPTRVS